MNNKKILLLSLMEEEESQKEEIQIIPTIDVMMFLLVFFILYTLNVIPLFQQKLEIPSTKTAEQQNLKEEIIKIYISKDGEPKIDNKIIGISSIENYIKENKQNIKGILVITDKGAKVESVLKIIDIAKSEDITNIGIASNKEGQ